MGKKILWNYQSISVTHECWIFMTCSQCHFLGEILSKYFLQHLLYVSMCFCLSKDNLFFMKFCEDKKWSWWNWMMLSVFSFLLVLAGFGLWDSGHDLAKLLRRQRQWWSWCDPYIMSSTHPTDVKNVASTELGHGHVPKSLPLGHYDATRSGQGLKSQRPR